jgi:plastocyanin
MRYGVTLSLLALVACGGTSSSTTGGTNDQVAILSIKSTGISTQTGGAATFSVPNPGAVQFTNSDTAPHNIASTDSGCGALNTGTLAAGASSSTLTLTNPGTTDIACTFKDTLNPTAAAFTGTVTILTSSTGGSGY